MRLLEKKLKLKYDLETVSIKRVFFFFYCIESWRAVSINPMISLSCSRFYFFYFASFYLVCPFIPPPPGSKGNRFRGILRPIFLVSNEGVFCFFFPFCIV